MARDRWLTIRTNAIETAFVMLPVLFPGPGTQARGSSRTDGPPVPESPRGSRAFWLYCSVLSLLSFVIGWGILHGSPVYRLGAAENSHRPTDSIVWFAVFVPVTLLCLVNAVRGKP